jgi:endonuclease YncB( thermonuclease family)
VKFGAEVLKFYLTIAGELSVSAMKLSAKCVLSILNNRKQRWLILLAVITLAALWRAIPEAPEGEILGQASVRDGDSLIIGRKRIRLIGIDAPERDQDCGEGAATWRCGRQAGAHLDRLIGGGAVACAYFERDRYGRYLAACTISGRDLGEAMVRDGFAVDLNGRYSGAQSEARSARRGLWQGPFVRPAVWRRQNPRE